VFKRQLAANSSRMSIIKSLQEERIFDDGKRTMKDGTSQMNKNAN